VTITKKGTDEVKSHSLTNAELIALMKANKLYEEKKE